MLREYTYLREEREVISMITSPPPLTVSIVLHNKFGVIDSKS